MLFMATCSLHMSDDVVAVLTRVRARIIRFALETTHIFQVLDVVLFCSLKKLVTGLETLDEERVPAQGLSRLQTDHD
jgi:uncharacterized membrane protein